MIKENQEGSNKILTLLTVRTILKKNTNYCQTAKHCSENTQERRFLGFRLKKYCRQLFGSGSCITGLSIIELLIAVACFGMVAAAIIILILNVYSNIQQNKEESLAIFLAEEGLEATRSIRDNNWDTLTNGEHGLVISGNNWVFQGTEEDISGVLRAGERKIIVEEIDSDEKKVTSQTSWKISETQIRNVSLISYLTNWQKEGPQGQCQGTPTSCSERSESHCHDGCSWTPGGGYCESEWRWCFWLDQSHCQNCPYCSWSQFFHFCFGWLYDCSKCTTEGECNACGCPWQSSGGCSGTPTPCENFIIEEDCISQDGCTWEEY